MEKEEKEMKIDIHSHILPDIDDGAKSLDVSISMAKMYVENGYNKVIATPHYFDINQSKSPSDLLEAKSILDKALLNEGIDLKILLGNEVYFSDDTLSDIQKKNAFTLNNTRYVLIEFPSTDIPNYTEDVIFSLQLKGYIPIISHPERNTRIMKSPNILYELVEKGVLAQLNIHSLTGLYGAKSMELSECLLKHNLIHFVATDSHSDGRRSPNVIKALKKLRKTVDSKLYDKIIYTYPEALINNEVIITDQPLFIEKKESLKSKILSLF